MHPNGDEVHKVFGDGYEITIKNKNVLIKGVCNLEVVGDCNMKVGGDYNLDVEGDFNLTTKGVMKVGVKKKIDIQTDAQLFLKSTQPAGIGVQIDGDSSVGVVAMIKENSFVVVEVDLLILLLQHQVFFLYNFQYQILMEVYLKNLQNLHQYLN